MNYQEFVEQGGLSIEQKIEMYEYILEELVNTDLLNCKRVMGSYPFICNKIIRFIFIRYTLSLFDTDITDNYGVAKEFYTKYFPEFVAIKPDNSIWLLPWWSSKEFGIETRISLITKILENLKRQQK